MDYVNVFQYHGKTIAARKQDYVSVYETLLNGEYDFVTSLGITAKNPVILDAGANIGCTALYLLHNFPGAKVVSLEPAPDTYAILSRNHAANPGLDWHIVNRALWSKTARLSLKRMTLSTGHRVQEAGLSDEGIDAIGLPELMTEYGIQKIDLAKLDIEGAEADVIPQIRNLLPQIEIMICEIHGDRMDPKPVLDILFDAYSHRYIGHDKMSNKYVLVLANKPVSHSSLKPVSIADDAGNLQLAA
jgi:FkbM family methyltransferase